MARVRGGRRSSTWRAHGCAADDRVLAAAALAAMVAMLAAGMFEYNFGDSEFLMMLLLVVTLPFAAARAPRADART